MVNGKVYSWEDITINVQGLEDIAITEITYDFEQEAELIYRSGGSPCGYGTGNKKNTVKISMGREDYNRVLAWCKKKGKKLSRLPLDKITVSYANEDQDTVTGGQREYGIPGWIRLPGRKTQRSKFLRRRMRI